MSTAHGQCVCGLFRYTVAGSFGEVRYCHCSQCRRKSGTAFSANARIDRSQWSLQGPADQITEFEHKPGLYNAFCARCGSPLYARSDADPDDIRVRLGEFDGPLDVTVTGHVWTSSKAQWYSIEDSIPQFAEKFIDKDGA
ncbi:MAG: GFA family protein [Gemmatimonadales bacterium]